MIERLQHLAQTIHQAHHGKGTATWETCRQHACAEIRKLIEMSAEMKPAKKRGRFPQIGVWLVSKIGVLPNDLPQEIARSSIEGITWGHTFGTWTSANGYIRECIKDGWTVSVYEVW